MITIYRNGSDRRIISLPTEPKAIAWCRKNQLTDNWQKDYSFIEPLRRVEFYTWQLSNDLHQILREGDRDIHELSKRMYLDETAVIYHLRKWIKAGWVEPYRSSDDRRTVVYRLTDEGKAIEIVHVGSEQSIKRAKEIMGALWAESPLSVRAIANRLNLRWIQAWYVVKILARAGVVCQDGHECTLRGHHGF